MATQLRPPRPAAGAEREQVPDHAVVGRRDGWPTALAVGLVVVFAGLVSALSWAAHVGWLVPTDVAATPVDIARGEVWRIVASAFVADEPLGVSLVSLVLIAGIALRACGWRIFWIAALVGHVGSTLVVYGIIAVSRLVAGGVFEHALAAPDYGVSAMEGAWVGATAATAWLATRGSAARGLVVLGVAGVGAAAWEIHPDPSVLTLEHPVAFLLGIGIALAVRSRAQTRS